jgi:hypothetical protein
MVEQAQPDSRGSYRRPRSRERRNRPTASRSNRVVSWWLGSAIGSVIGRSMVLLRYTARDGRIIVLPVQAARSGLRTVVLVGDCGKKHWWRHFIVRSTLSVFVDRRWTAATGLVVSPEADSVKMYRSTHPQRLTGDDQVFVAITLDAAPAPLRGGELLLLWFWIVTIAEFFGFAVPALIGAATSELSAAISLPALLIAGAVEGAILGRGQTSVLRLALPELPQRRWIASTAAAAALAYLIGLSPSLLADSVSRWPTPVVIATGSGLGLILLTSIGTAQWLILRTQVDRAGSWIITTATAWLAGLGVFLGFAMPLWRPGQSLFLTVAIGLTGGLLMAATSSAITGLAIHRLVDRSAARTAEGNRSVA